MRRRADPRHAAAAGPAAEAMAGAGPEVVANSPRQQLQARQIAALQAPSAASSPAQLTRSQAPVQLNDDRNWWQRNAPYVFGGKAAHEDRSYTERWLPTSWGGKPVPQAPVVKPPVQKPKEKSYKELVREDQARRKKEAAEQRKLDLAKPRQDPLPKSEDSTPFYFDSGPTRSQIKGAKKQQKREEQARLDQERLEQARQQRLAATKSLPRRVVRYDRNFASLTNNSGQGKAHRVGSDLDPAGGTSVTAVEQLHQDSPHKGSSDRTSFSSLRAAEVNDYSAKGTRPSVEFKARKHARARIKGKQDALGFDSVSAHGVLAEVQADKSLYATTQVVGRDGVSRTRKTTAKNFATRDGESQTIGTIPARFLRWSDQVGADPADSDSDDEDTDTE